MRNAAAAGNFCLSALVAHDVCKVNLVSGITDHSHLNLMKSPVLSALGSRTLCYIKLFKYIAHLDEHTWGGQTHTLEECLLYLPTHEYE